MTDNITKRDQIIISLLGRLAYPEDKLKDIITRKKRNPDAYIRGYNACDGKRIVNDIAKVIGVSQPTLSPILQEWERIGIIFEVESSKGGKTYMNLYPLPEPKEKLMATQVPPIDGTSDTQILESKDMGEQNGQ